ncbi:hypothetical protein CRG98_014609 [Punica granatum]|uniref:Uncharacterized protein n=1 Tax=Punica granatum TaxID=22663 RepID=A0A2I0K8W3_PUNGR|nr:hypothetical protein CRG98_014609 [Punica granatum]
MWTNVRVARRLESRSCPVWALGVELSAPGLRLPFVHLIVRLGDPLASCGIVRSSSPTEDRWPGKTWGLARFRVPFTCQWVGPLGVPSEKASVRVWGRPDRTMPDSAVFGARRLLTPPIALSCSPSGLCFLCAPEFNLVGAPMREAMQRGLGVSVHLPGDSQRTRVRRSHHLPFTTRRLRAVESPGSRGTGYT